jgi:hypothetical protein
LIEFDVGRSTRFNKDDFWGAGRYSGGPEVEMEYSKLNATKRQPTIDSKLPRLKPMMNCSSRPVYIHVSPMQWRNASVEHTTTLSGGDTLTLKV